MKSALLIVVFILFFEIVKNCFRYKKIKELWEKENREKNLKKEGE